MCWCAVKKLLTHSLLHIVTSNPARGSRHSLALDIPLNILPCTFLWTILAPSPQKIPHLDILPVHFTHRQSPSQQTFPWTIPPWTFHPDILLPWTFPWTFSPVHSSLQFHPGHFTRTFSCPGHSPQHSPLYIPVDNSTPDISPGHSPALDIPLKILPCTFLWTIPPRTFHLDILLPWTFPWTFSPVHSFGQFLPPPPKKKFFI